MFSNFCLDHRTETAHNCQNAGEWARRRTQANQGSVPPSGPKIPSERQQCALPSCKTVINTPLSTGVHCEQCNRSYCLKHRLAYEHDCANLVPIGARPSAGPTQKEKGSALQKLRAWGKERKAAIPKVPQSKAKVSAAQQIQAIATLKRTAKGDDKVPVEKRLYLYVEASNDTVTSKLPRGNFYYSSEHSIGRVLDQAAKSLQVSNMNNRSESEEDKLRVFHIEGGRLLDFGEKLGSSVQTGNTIVLLRGVGPGMARTPEQTKAT